MLDMKGLQGDKRHAPNRTKFTCLVMALFVGFFVACLMSLCNFFGEQLLVAPPSSWRTTLGYIPLAGFCEYGNEPAGCIRMQGISRTGEPLLSSQSHWVSADSVLSTKWCHMYILSRDGVTIDGVLIGNRIYWTILQLVTTIYQSLSHTD
jgi:hypothetical protein